MIFLTALALGAPTDADILALTSTELGKEVPMKYLCVSRPEIRPLTSPLVAVGIKVKGIGCSLKGVVYEGKWFSPEAGLVAALPGFSSLKLPQKESVSQEYIRGVLLAFTQQYGPTTVVSSGKQLIVTTPISYRIPDAFHSVDANSQITLDPSGLVSSQEYLDKSVYRSRLVMRIHQAKGMSTDTVQAALEKKGKLTKMCFYNAWLSDLRTAASARLAWDIKKDTAPKVRVVRTTADNALMQCYSNALGKVEFPSDGHVELTFGIQRLKQAN